MASMREYYLIKISDEQRILLRNTLAAAEHDTKEEAEEAILLRGMFEDAEPSTWVEDETLNDFTS